MGEKINNILKGEIISSVFYILLGLCLILIPTQTVDVICKVVFGLILIGVGIYIEMDPRTKGAIVYENMETSIPGVFACGNVVQVHDLVDFVSGESELAGAAAANYIQNGPVATGRVLTVKPGADLGYTLPQRIRLEGVEKSTNVSFRVRRICGKSTILVKSGDTVIARFKRDRLAPGEMEHIALPKVLLDRAPMDEVTIEIEEA